MGGTRILIGSPSLMEYTNNSSRGSTLKKIWQWAVWQCILTIALFLTKSFFVNRIDEFQKGAHTTWTPRKVWQLTMNLPPPPSLLNFDSDVYNQHYWIIFKVKVCISQFQKEGSVLHGSASASKSVFENVCWTMLVWTFDKIMSISQRIALLLVLVKRYFRFSLIFGQSCQCNYWKFYR